MMDEDPCGVVLEIGSAEIIQFGFTQAMEGTILVCSRPFGHTPRDQHSDGVTDWKGDETP